MAARLTQKKVLARCESLANSDPETYVSISLSTIKQLESGKRKPRLMTASTLAAVLGEDIPGLFPNGIDDPNRNQEGKSGTPGEQKKRGRPPKT